MKKLAFGIDIGGINTAFGLVDEKGELFGESVISTRAYPNYQDYPRYVADLCEAMKTLVAGVNFDFELIGIGDWHDNYSLLCSSAERSIFPSSALAKKREHRRT